ncbi:polysaccharide biosynthesis/export family protein [Hymenobacter negativus]|nr:MULTISPECIES: polysaccharide biosynthesis/export family protein [Bacteria]MBR7208064.1 polysaccharide biosynthesis/export family protein [Microvirga sp. STS02]
MSSMVYFRTWVLGLLMAGALLGSCVSQQQLPYLQSKDYSTRAAVQVDNERQVYRLQPGDVLAIRVQSVQPALNDLFSVTSGQNIQSGDPGNIFASGYSVDDTGSINLPTAGRLKVAGLTVEETQQLIQKEVARFMREANVLVKLTSFKLTILGEVRAPGRYFVYNSQATVLEALGLAGDVGEFGNRTNVKLIRQTPKGSEVVLLDLTDPNLLRSKYYYLLPNDALYVEPLKARTSRGNANNLGLVFGGLSTIILLLSFIKAN